MQVKISFKFRDGNFNQGFGLDEKSVIEVNYEGKSTRMEFKLSPAPKTPILYQKWQNEYIKLANSWLARIKLKKFTSFSYPERYQECEQIAGELRDNLNYWLSDIRLKLESVIKLNSDSEIIFIIDAQNIECQSIKDLLYRIPWREWDYFTGNYNLEAALCLNDYQSRIKNKIKNKIQASQDINKFRRVKITSIFGDSRGINIQVDKEIIEKLSQRGAELLVLSQPRRSDFIKLWDRANASKFKRCWCSVAAFSTVRAIAL
ncbi:MAG: hypothetical protein MJK14_22205 [Rivularia sp. ALOHA_DT_140]|nr:hypothetical protein [Rivularia sp. ALOHA_DT_140]